tara:strand:+ start:312 stop:650 length:339 start_codon:yes stop_codon:yes gene_type:complete
MEEPIFNAQQAAEYLKLSRRQVDRYLEAGTLVAVKKGGAWHIKKSALDNLERPRRGGYDAVMVGKLIKSRKNAEKLIDDKMESDSWTEAEHEIIRGERSAFDEVATKSEWKK